MLRPKLILACSTIFSLLLASTSAQANTLASVAIQSAQSNAQDTPLTTIAEDFNLPVTLTSQHQALDGKKKTSIFTNNVVIRQGSLELLADRVELDATGGKRNEIIMATGKPASYKQRLEDGTMVEARANEIIYTVASRTISLKGNASIVQNELLVDGDSIQFDMAKEQILASTDENSSGPVTTVISPGAFSAESDKDDKPQQ